MAYEEINPTLQQTDVICTLNCNCEYILTVEQGHRIIKCIKCGDVKPI